MKAEQVIQRMIQVLPTFTDKFSNQAAISSIVVNGSNADVVTATPHGIDATKKVVLIAGVGCPIDVTSLTQVDGVATCVTAQPHDLTYNPADNPVYQMTATFSGADQAEWNQTFNVTNVVSDTEFNFEIVDTATSPATGSILCDDGKDRGFNGYKPNVTITSPTEFSFVLTETPPNPGIGGNAISSFRISGSDSVERILAAYTKQGPDQLWAWVVLGDDVISRNRQIESDAEDIWAAGTEFRNRIIQEMDIYVISPVDDEITARAARDVMQEIRLPLFKTLLGHVFPEDMSEKQVYGLTFVSSRAFSYANAYYVHQFAFQNIVDVTYNDTAAQEPSVAFRRIEGNITTDQALELTEPIQVQVNVDEQS